MCYSGQTFSLWMFAEYLQARAQPWRRLPWEHGQGLWEQRLRAISWCSQSELTTPLESASKVFLFFKSVLGMLYQGFNGVLRVFRVYLYGVSREPKGTFMRVLRLLQKCVYFLALYSSKLPSIRKKCLHSNTCYIMFAIWYTISDTKCLLLNISYLLYHTYNLTIPILTLAIWHFMLDIC